MKLSKNLKDGESILISPLRRGKKVERIAFGKERDFVPSVYNTSDAVFNRDYCDDCGTKQGEYHMPDCDIEICPLCKKQKLSCEWDLILMDAD